MSEMLQLVPNYEVGEKVQGKIKRIEPYGAFVSLDQLNVGLIHLSKIKNDYVGNIHKHFRVGDDVVCEILQHDGDGKYKLSTIGMELPEYEIDSMHLEETKELNQIYHYMKTFVPFVSEDAKEKIQQLIINKGMVSFVLGMSKVIQECNQDVSLFLVKSIEKEIEDGL